MIKLIIVPFLVGLQISSLTGHANTRSLPQGCACHCAPDTAAVRIWREKEGRPERFAARVVNRWVADLGKVYPIGQFTKTELLIILGKSPRGIWSLEAQQYDNSSEIQTELVCTTTAGKHKVFPVVKGHSGMSMLGSLVSRRLRQLAASGRWDAASLIPVPLPLLSKPPALVLHKKEIRDSFPEVWQLSVRAKKGRLVRINGGRVYAGVGYFRGAKCMIGIADEAEGETWWVLVKTAMGDACSAEWHSIRLPHKVSTQK